MTAKNKEVLLASVLLAQQKGQHNCGYTLSLEVDYRFNEQVDLGRFKPNGVLYRLISKISINKLKLILNQYL